MKTKFIDGFIPYDEQLIEDPLSPANLVGALQDPVHRDVGRYRPAKATRAKPPSPSEDQ